MHWLLYKPSICKAIFRIPALDCIAFARQRECQEGHLVLSVENCTAELWNSVHIYDFSGSKVDFEFIVRQIKTDQAFLTDYIFIFID